MQSKFSKILNRAAHNWRISRPDKADIASGEVGTTPRPQAVVLSQSEGRACTCRLISSECLLILLLCVCVCVYRHGGGIYFGEGILSLSVCISDAACIRSSAVRLERALEAVYISFALFGEWKPQAMVLPQTCASIGGLKFLKLCQAAGMIDDRFVTASALRTVFRMYCDKVACPEHACWSTFK